MNHILLISHGRFAEGLQESAKLIAGEDFLITSLCLLPGEDRLVFEEKTKIFLASFDRSSDLVVFCDIFFGSPITSFLKIINETKEPKAKVIFSGMNLAGLLTAMLSKEPNLEKFTQNVIDESRRSITVIDPALNKIKNSEI